MQLHLPIYLHAPSPNKTHKNASVDQYTSTTKTVINISDACCLHIQALILPSHIDTDVHFSPLFVVCKCLNNWSIWGHWEDRVGNGQ